MNILPNIYMPITTDLERLTSIDNLRRISLKEDAAQPTKANSTIQEIFRNYAPFN
jgi:hypothetical protein